MAFSFMSAGYVFPKSAQSTTDIRKIISFAAIDVHMSDLITGRESLDRFTGAAFCGGFSYGDVVRMTQCRSRLKNLSFPSSIFER